MTLAIVADPQIRQPDLMWIENFRARHDPQTSRIGVHFTLVFPFDGTIADLGPEFAAAAQSFPPISFAIHEAIVVPDSASGSSYIFLVPGDGGSQIRALHECLYPGALRRHLRADIPFVPHMTIGAARDSQEAERLAREIAAAASLVTGHLTSLEVVDVGATRVDTLTAYALTGRT